MALWVPRCWTQTFLKPPADPDRQLTTGECWSMLLLVDAWYRYMLWFADGFYRADSGLNFPPFAASRPPSILLVACSCLGNYCVEQRRCWTFCTSLRCMFTCTVCLPPIAYSTLSSTLILANKACNEVWEVFCLHGIGPRFSAIDAIMPGVAKTRAAIGSLNTWDHSTL